jgi:hypothetical protein
MTKRVDTPVIIIGDGIMGTILAYILHKEKGIESITLAGEEWYHSAYLSNFNTLQSGLLQAISFFETDDFSTTDSDEIKKGDYLKKLMPARKDFENIIGEAVFKNLVGINPSYLILDTERQSKFEEIQTKFGNLSKQKYGETLNDHVKEGEVCFEIPDRTILYNEVTNTIRKQLIDENRTIYIKSKNTKFKQIDDSKYEFYNSEYHISIIAEKVIITAGLNTENILTEICPTLETNAKYRGYCLKKYLVQNSDEYLKNKNEELVNTSNQSESKFKDLPSFSIISKLNKAERKYVTLASFNEYNIRVANNGHKFKITRKDETNTLMSYNDNAKCNKIDINKHLKKIDENVKDFNKLTHSVHYENMSKITDEEQINSYEQYCIHITENNSNRDREYCQNIEYFKENSIIVAHPGLASNCINTVQEIIKNISFSIEKISSDNDLDILKKDNKKHKKDLQTWLANQLIE